VRKTSPENEHEAAGFFCTTTQLHIGSSSQKVTYQSQHDGFGAATLFSRLVTAQLSLVSKTKKWVV
jgi:hypothetical protein